MNRSPIAVLSLIALALAVFLLVAVVASPRVAGDATRGALLQPQLKAPSQGTATIASNNDMLKVAAVGDPAPEELGGTFSEIEPISIGVLPDGRVTFRAKISGGASSEGLFLWSSGQISKIVAAGDPTGTEIGGTFSSFEGWAAGDGQEWVFVASVSGGTSTKGIFLKSEDGFAKIAAAGDAAPTVGGEFSAGFSPPARNSLGQVAFTVDVQSGTASQGIFLWDSGTLTKVVAEGDPSPLEGIFQKHFSSFGNPGFGEDGAVGFWAWACSWWDCTLGLFTMKDGEATKTVAQGDPTPLGGTFSNFGGGAGGAFSASVSGGAAPSGIFLISGTKVSREVVAVGEQTPIGGTFSSLGGLPWAAGAKEQEVFFTAELSGGPVPKAIFLDKAGCTASLVRYGDATPIGGTFSEFNSLAVSVVDQLVFSADVNGGSSSFGVFLAPTLASLPDADPDQDGIEVCTDACPDLPEDIDGYEDGDGCPDPGVSGVSYSDKDDDGLPDVWEESGIDMDGDGYPELDLKALGADPWRKDIFVEIDFMDCGVGGTGCPLLPFVPHSHRPNPDAIARVQAAFDQAPIAPPPGAPPGTRGGVNLHVPVLDEEGIPHASEIGLKPWSCGGAESFDDIKAAYFGTPAERQNPLKIAAKKLVFRYAIFADSLNLYDAENGTCKRGAAAGIGEVGGNDLIVTVGDPGSYYEVSGAFMHELGHTLGLLHGGNEWLNCKPNYLSIMTYSRGMGWAYQRWGEIPSLLDYSDAELEPLKEANLDERAGVGGASSDVVVYGVDGALATPVPADGPVDWNGSKGEPEPSVSADINWITKVCDEQSPGDELKGYNDWANLKYSFRESSDFAALVHVTLPAEPDPTRDDLLQARADAPDFDGDTVPTVEDNCPFAFNPSQEDFDGDGSPGVSPGPGDSFGGDACDPDDDNDAFLDTAELYLGTDPLDACPDSPTDDAWPLDINMDKQLSVVGDVLNFRGRIGATPGSPQWWQRLDFNADGQLSVVGDVLMYRDRIGETCT